MGCGVSYKAKNVEGVNLSKITPLNDMAFARFYVLCPRNGGKPVPKRKEWKIVEFNNLYKRSDIFTSQSVDAARNCIRGATNLKMYLLEKGTVLNVNDIHVVSDTTSVNQLYLFGTALINNEDIYWFTEVGEPKDVSIIQRVQTKFKIIENNNEK